MERPDGSPGGGRLLPEAGPRDDAGTVRSRGPPGRETAAARSSERWIWYGYGTLTRNRKDGIGTFLHDTVRLYAEVSVLALPALFYVWLYPRTVFFDVTAMAMVAWMTMTVTGTLVRGGWVHPPATATPGWVTLAPSLLALRVPYFNLALLVASFGGLAVSGLVGRPLAGGLWAGGVAALSMLAFPRVVDEWMARRRR
jgi:hypothetical protein